jgi:hypothetical protein
LEGGATESQQTISALPVPTTVKEYSKKTPVLVLSARETEQINDGHGGTRHETRDRLESAKDS